MKKMKITEDINLFVRDSEEEVDVVEGEEIYLIKEEDGICYFNHQNKILWQYHYSMEDKMEEVAEEDKEYADYLEREKRESHLYIYNDANDN